ncbi:MAG: type II secretion system F family protein [Planctomycetes bacterium]|nr:type II secretion system F family protein [Planctomycetota bacterium]
MFPGLERDMELAGLDSMRARRGFMVAALIGPLVLAALAAWVTAGPDASGLGVTLMAGLGAAIGWWLPRAWLEGRRERCRMEIASDFPVMLDLLQISLNGGLGLPAAWATVTASLRGTSDALAREMRRVDLESGFGVGWSASLAAAAERTGVAEFRSLGSLLGQTQRFGTELSRTIQVLADSLRHEEMQSLEERAHRASVRMLLPLAGLVLPPTILVVAGPLFMMLLEGLRAATPD